jgi:hypothetical protein
VGSAGAGVQIADISNVGPPHFRAKHCSTGLEIHERLREAALGEPEPCTGGRDQNGTHTCRPPLLWQKREQRLCLGKSTRLDRDISQNGRGKSESRPKITLAQDL